MSRSGTLMGSGQIHSIPFIYSLEIRLQYVVISEAELVKVVQAITGENILPVNEFTCVLDRRELPETVGFIVELAENIGVIFCNLVGNSVHDTYAMP